MLYENFSQLLILKLHEKSQTKNVEKSYQQNKNIYFKKVIFIFETASCLFQNLNARWHSSFGKEQKFFMQFCY